jgi:hypothetical protein
MNRRAVLGGIAGLASTALTAGCAGVLGEKPLQVRATPADGDETEVRCDLPAGVVEDHPALHDVLRMADDERGAADTDWVTRGVTRERGEAIRDALEGTCERTGGLYRWEGGWFFVSIRVT